MVKKLLINIYGFLKASRIPNLLIIAATQSMVAVHLLNKSYEDVLSFHFFLFLGSTLLIAAAGYIINDYYDQKIDMVNRPDRVVVGVLLKRRLALASHFLLSIVGIALGFLLDKWVGIVHIISTVSLWTYSNHFRRQPFIGNLIIGAMTGLTVVIVAVYYRQYDALVLVYAFFAGTITLIREIIKDIEDVKGESAFGCKTIPVIWGIRGAKWVIYSTSLIGLFFLVAFLIRFSDSRLWMYFGILSPFYIWFIYKLISADKQKEYVFLHRFCNAIIFSGIVSIIFL
jgi:4-hydroxybenzoate polyprenyltransferase